MSYTLLPILSSDTIGDSLSSVNLNYLNLDEYITNTVQFSADNIWVPLRNFYQLMKSELANTYQIAVQGKQYWDSCQTTVSQNSAKWIAPLVVVYANPIHLQFDNTIAQNTVTSITDWFNLNFPASDSKGNVLYVQNQLAYVYLIVQQQTTNYSPLQLFYDSTQCVTADIDLQFNCTTTFTGVAVCSNGNKGCGGSANCTQSSHTRCVYGQSGYETYIPYIEATLDTTYTDTHESPNMPCLVFSMQSCNWVYTKQI
jgi:hypothetical protein